MKNPSKKRTHSHGLIRLGMIAIGLAALLPLAVSFAQTVSFSPATNFAVGSSPFFLAVGDLNGDGNPDLAVASNRSNSISILLGTGTGSFGAKIDFGTVSPLGIAIADLNLDGKLDLSVTNSGVSTMSVLLGNGDGFFGTSTVVATGLINNYSIAVGDFNMDGKPDLAVVNFPDRVSVVLGNGDGTFGAKANFATGSSPFSIAIGDFDGNGKPDLVTANLNSNTVSVLLGTGTGSFSPKTDFATGSFPFGVAIGDVNEDGKPDLATANLNSNTVSVLLGNGTGAFGAKTDFTTGAGPGSVAIGDVNADGKPDLAVANLNSNTVSVLLGTGTGSFSPKTDFATGINPRSIRIVDVNTDGKPDLAMANFNGNNVSILLNTTVSPNQPPVASAGPDLTVEATNPAGASVTLDGSGSSDPDGDPLTYDWTGSFGAVTGVSPTVVLPLGTHAVMLTVSDGQATATDNVVIIVQDTTSPETSITSTMDGNGAAVSSDGSTLSGSITFTFEGTDAVGVVGFQCSLDGSPFTSRTSPATYTGLAIGTHSFQVRAFDAAGNVDPTPAAFTWTILTPAEATQNLTTTIDNMGLPAGVANSLGAPMDQVSTLLNDTNPNNDIAACGKLGAFINQVNAKAQNGQLTSAQAAQLIAAAENITAALGCISSGGNGNVANSFNIEGSEEAGKVMALALHQSYPNPFNPSTTIEYHLTIASHVKLSVFDILGREIAVLVDESKSDGKHRVTFDASNFPGGIYFYRVQIGEFQATRTLILLK